MRRAARVRVQRKRWVTTTQSTHGLPIYPNLTKGLPVSNINELWVADFTYIRIMTCFVYLAVILDAFSRKAIGYCLSQRLDTELALGALWMAICDSHPAPGCIHHSDHGVQYASGEYIKESPLYGFQISMSRRANPYENAHAESFIKTLKSEEIYLWEYRTMEDILDRIPSFIKDVYNQKQLHSSLGYRPPCEFETMAMVTQNPCQSTLIAAL